MKPKNLLSLVLALMLVFALTACTKSSPNASEPVPPSVSPITVETNPSNGTGVHDSNAAVIETPPEVVYVSYSIQSAGPFSEDRAWVKYGDQHRPLTALIDSTGNVLYHTDDEVLYSSPFEDGLSYYLVNVGRNDNRYFILDSDGNVLSSNINSENNYTLLSYADGHFIVAEHITGFDANEWHMGTIDQHGQIKNILQPRPGIDIARVIDHLYSNHTIEFGNQERVVFYAGDGIVSLTHAGGLYCVRNDETVVLTDDNGSSLNSMRQFRFHGRFHDGFTLASYPLRSSGPWVSVIMSSAYLTGDLGNTEIFRPAPFSIGTYSEGLHFSEGSLLTNGITVYSDAFYNHQNVQGYYDLEQLVIGFPEYEGRNLIGAPFKGGYAAIGVQGADGAMYVTVIDKAGNKMYELIKIDEKIGENDGIDRISASGGYIYTKIDGADVIINPNGVISPGGRLPSNTVSIPTPVTMAEERVISPSAYTGSFNMAGMWRSESGTILSFNANGSVGPMFFGFEGGPDGSWSISSSANENGHYTLQASHITGGNPIYTVRLISANEIELYEESGVSFGRSYYLLTRQ